MEKQKTIIKTDYAQRRKNLNNFKRSVDDLLDRRSYFMSKVMPSFIEGQDYYVIKGKKSLAKGGAEKLSSIYNLTSIFEKDIETLEMLGNVDGVVCYVCNLKSNNGNIVGQGRGSDSLDKNNGDYNKTIKMAQKRAYVDAIIRTTGLSDIFTQDVEDATNREFLNENNEIFINSQQDNVSNDFEQDVITNKQRNLLSKLILEKFPEEDEQEEKLSMLDNLSKQEASSMINSLIYT